MLVHEHNHGKIDLWLDNFEVPACRSESEATYICEGGGGGGGGRQIEKFNFLGSAVEPA